MSSNVKLLNEDNFNESIQANLNLVEFFAPWCGPCRMLTPILEELAKEMEGKAFVAKVDTDESPSISEKYQVTSVPTILLFKEGSEVARVVGLQDAETLKNLISSHLS